MDEAKVRIIISNRKYLRKLAVISTQGMIINTARAFSDYLYSY